MGILKDTCSKCGHSVVPGSLHRVKGTKSIRICAQCKLHHEAIDKRVEEVLNTVISILYPVL